MDNVGKRIKKLRTDIGLSQKQLADAVGIKQPSVADIEAGETKSPAALTLIKMAKIFEIDPEYLLTGKGPKHSVATLTHEEAELVLMFRSLSDTGRAYLLERAKSMHADEYRNRSDRSDGQEEPNHRPKPPAVN